MLVLEILRSFLCPGHQISHSRGIINSLLLHVANDHLMNHFFILHFVFCFIKLAEIRQCLPIDLKQLSSILLAQKRYLLLRVPHIHLLLAQSGQQRLNRCQVTVRRVKGLPLIYNILFKESSQHKLSLYLLLLLRQHLAADHRPIHHRNPFINLSCKLIIVAVLHLHFIQIWK
jgi:hypothetical protein